MKNNKNTVSQKGRCLMELEAQNSTFFPGSLSVKKWLGEIRSVKDILLIDIVEIFCTSRIQN